MKRIAIFALVGLMLVGLAGLAADEVPTDSTFNIPNKYDFTESGDLLFPSTSTVTDPGATGWFNTNSKTITFKTNYNLTIGLTQSAFCSGSTKLDTEAKGTGTFFPNPFLDTWTDVPQCTKTWIATYTFSPGVYSGSFKLRVYRSGYSDPSGTYQSSCFIKVYTE